MADDHNDKKPAADAGPQFRLAVNNPSPALSPSPDQGPAKPFNIGQPPGVAGVHPLNQQFDPTRAGAQRRAQAERAIEIRKNLLDRSNKERLKARVFRWLFFTALVAAAFGVDMYWHDIFPPDTAPADPYRHIATYNQRKNVGKKVEVRYLRYDLLEIRRCPAYCVAEFRDDQDNRIGVGFPLRKYYGKLKAINGRVNVKGVLANDGDSKFILHVHRFHESGGVDFRKFLGLD